MSVGSQKELWLSSCCLKTISRPESIMLKNLLYFLKFYAVHLPYYVTPFERSIRVYAVHLPYYVTPLNVLLEYLLCTFPIMLLLLNVLLEYKS